MKDIDRVTNEAEFTRFMESNKPGSIELTSLRCIQACIKAKHGFGKHIPIHFRMELNIDEEKNISKQLKSLSKEPLLLKYDYKAIGQSVDISDEGMLSEDKEAKIDKWLIENAIEDYCLK